VEKKIEHIISINLINLSFNIDEEELRNQKDGVIEIGFRYGISEALRKNDEGVYLVNVIFNLALGDGVEKEEFQKVITGSGVSLEYEMAFSSTIEILEVDNDLRKEIFSVIEPYLREKTNYLFSSSKHGVPPIPYNFWNISEE